MVEIVTGPCIRGQSFMLGLCLTSSVNLSNMPLILNFLICNVAVIIQHYLTVILRGLKEMKNVNMNMSP